MQRIASLALAALLSACVATGDESAAAESAVTADPGGPYPIVLAHGFFGFEKFAGADFINYFYQVKDHLAAEGETEVFTPAVDPFNDSEYRGKQLLAHVERIVRETGAKKVNLIGHSQGGLDARYVARKRPDLVASVVTFATPHHGTPVADVALGIVGNPVAGKIVDQFVKFFGRPIWDEVGNETSLAKSVHQLSTPDATAFDAAYPDVPGIPYWSIAGRTARSLGGDECEVANSPAFIKRWDNVRDTTEPLFKPAELLVGGMARRPNDGLIAVESARRGNFLGCIPADHLDQIGHIAGDNPGWHNDFNHLEFYSGLVAWLRAQGY